MKMCFVPRSRWLTAAALTAMLGLAALPNAARADTETFQITVGNAALSPFPTPFGTLTIDRTSTTSATATFTGNTITTGGHTYVYRFGQVGAIAVNSTGTSSASDPVVPNTSTSLGFSGGGSGKEGAGFGDFTHLFDDKGDGTGKAAAEFTLTATGGTTWASVADVLTSNADGNIAAGHVLVFVDGATSAIATGFAVNGPDPVGTPEFGSVTLMGIMLLGLGGITGFRRLRKPAMA